MGASGAGKTTLLNALALRGIGDTSGVVRLDNKPITKAAVRRYVGYVHQEDQHFAELTVKETLRFLCELIMVKATPEERECRVTDTLSVLGLTRVADKPVGHSSGVAGQRRGISGGERKRLSIGGALVTDPGLLFMDEFTSGLDSQSAVETTQMLKQLSDRGRTVICTIHQPSTELFMQFDTLCLLADGRIVYFGPVASVADHFASIGYPCPAYYNPAEHVIACVHVSGHLADGESQLSVSHVDEIEASRGKPFCMWQ